MPTSTTATILHDGTIELGFRGDDAASARLLATSVAAGIPIVSFARAATDLEELFLQVTGQDADPPATVGARHDRRDRAHLMDVTADVDAPSTTPVGESPGPPRRAGHAAARRGPRTSGLLLRTAGGDRRGRRQGASRPDARPAGVRRS